MQLIDYYKFISIMITEQRKKQGLTQRQLANKTKIPYGTISGIETAHGKPSIHNLHIIAAALDTNVHELCGGGDADFLSWNGIASNGEHFDYECKTLEEIKKKMSDDYIRKHNDQGWPADGKVYEDYATAYYGFSHVDYHVAIKQVDFDLTFNNWGDE